MQRSPTADVARLAAFVLLAVVLGLGVLYAYRSQTPAIPAVPLTQAVADVRSGTVRSVVIEGNRATLDLADGRREQTTVPDGPNDPLAAAIAERNRSDPSHATELRYGSGGPDALPIIGVTFVTLLPLAFLVLLILFAARVFARARQPDPYEQLARIADLRDRGVLTEEEFQREKRRLLR